MPGPMLHAVDIDADAATIFTAITTRDGLAGFWTSDCDAQAVIGTVSRFAFPAAPVDLHMRIEGLEASRSVSWTCLGDFPHWAGTTVTWDITPAAGGRSTVMFRQDGWGDDYPEIEYARVNYTWGRIVGALKSYAESGTPDPFLG